MTGLVPDPVPLAPPPGDPRVLTALAGRLGRAGDLLADLAAQVSADAGSVPSWRGLDASAATARLARTGELVRDAAGSLARAGRRVGLHAELLQDARRRFAALRAAQEEDHGAAAARAGSLVDPAGAGSGWAVAGAVDEWLGAEAARRRVADAIREEVARDAAVTAAVLAECGAVTGGSDRGQVLRYLADLLPGWREAELARHGSDFAAAVLAGDRFDGEEAARGLLPWAGEGAAAAAALTGLGRDGFRDVLRRLGDGSLSPDSALARVMAAVLGAAVPPGQAHDVARVRDGRLVDPDDHRSLDGDLVALGMGVVLAAGRGNRRAGPPLATVQAWGRQIVARERALGAARIVDHVRPGPADAPPGDPLEAVLGRLAGADDPAPAAALLRAEPTWTHLLARPWDDDGAAFAALVERAADEPGDVAVRSGLRALAVGLADDGDPAGRTVDPGTAAVIAPALAEAVAARPDVLAGPLARAADGEAEDRTLLRGLGHLSADPGAGPALDRGVAEALARTDGGAGAGSPDRAVGIAAGYAAVREYGHRLGYALDQFAAQEQADHRHRTTEVFKGIAISAPVVRAGLASLAVVRDLDGTWDADPDAGPHVPVEAAVRAAGGAPGAAEAYARVTEVLGTPTAPVSPPTDWIDVVVELVPGGGRTRDAVERGLEHQQGFWEERSADASAN